MERMLLPFILFFILFFLLYWFVFQERLWLQNLLILVGSYVFYGWSDWRFLFLLAGSSLVVWLVGLGMARRGGWFWVGLMTALGSLLYFKYLRGLLPLGLSFYTFKALSYLLDIRLGRIQATRDPVVFLSYLSFFPCVISGPIDRPGVLIPQLSEPRAFAYDQASDGMRQILWGLFKKVVIADNCAAFASGIFAHYAELPASELLFGAFLVTIQVYADFSGYSDMAIGLSRLLGFRVSRNFRYPFFARDIADFWRRWHITLTSWLTDYVFTPLAIRFRDYGKAGLILAILIDFALIGLWHGPRWTFLVFGLVHGCFFIPLLLGWRRGGALLTFFQVMLAFVLFRAPSMYVAVDYYRHLFSESLWAPFTVVEKVNLIVTLAGIALMLGVEWIQKDREHGLQIDGIRRFPVRACIYFALILVILTFGPDRGTDFIYFKF